MFQRPLTAREAVLEELRRAILTGELTPGEAIRPTSRTVQRRSESATDGGAESSLRPPGISFPADGWWPSG